MLILFIFRAFLYDWLYIITGCLRDWVFEDAINSLIQQSLTFIREITLPRVQIHITHIFAHFVIFIFLLFKQLLLITEKCIWFVIYLSKLVWLMKTSTIVVGYVLVILIIQSFLQQVFLWHPFLRQPFLWQHLWFTLTIFW